MESNIKGLVAAGHEMASELKAECGAVDMRSVAKLISDLATQLEVQLVRANALAAENAGLKSAHPQPFGPEMMKALDAYEKHQDEVPETGMLDAFFILRDSIRVETPATDAFLAEVRAQGVEMLAKNHQSIVNALKGDSLFSDGEYRHAIIASAATSFAAELRKGGNQ
ncbi:TPA: hypothetical protein ACHTQV_003606 [Escherichia coli]|uniref:hypothetical protein n=1 Tax=Escherichia coli TaxID=562 RepID=UPI000390AD0F|nr:hypothetical protein [Escherichia coli]EQP83897.1 hypothetical protein G743_00847 [Escherichia coli HVH 80 (4-2428830)]